MNVAHAKSISLGCIVTAGGIASVSSITKGQLPPLRIGVGVFVGGALLLALAEEAPGLAAGFASLVLVGSILREGIPAATQLEKALGGQP